MTTYESDFYQWIEDQTKLLQHGALERLDVANLIEELESMSARERRELINRLAVLLAHLLKWQYQRERRCTSWRLTINEQRRRLALLLDDSPSLRRRVSEFLPRAYDNAVRSALDEIGFYQSPFPETCPYPIEAILSEDYWPED